MEEAHHADPFKSSGLISFLCVCGRLHAYGSCFLFYFVLFSFPSLLFVVETKLSRTQKYSWIFYFQHSITSTPT